MVGGRKRREEKNKEKGKASERGEGGRVNTGIVILTLPLRPIYTYFLQRTTEDVIVHTLSPHM